MAAKQEVTAEEELTVKTQSRAPSAGAVLHQVIKSLIRNDLFFSEKMFKNANLMVLHLVSTAILEWCITGVRFDGSAVRLEKALDFLSRDQTEIEEATGTLGSRLLSKHLWMLLPI